MSKGVMFIAHDNDAIDYVSLAYAAGARLKRWVDLPVCLVTDWAPAQADPKCVDIVIKQEYKHTKNDRLYTDVNKYADFKNKSRCSVFDLSPFDQTILLDVDYVVNSTHLLKGFETDKAYLLPSEILNVAGNPIQESFFHIAGIPVYWATAIYFDKSDEAERLFNCVAHIRDNIDYYSARYKFPGGLYRNDYAFAIAHHILSGRNTEDRNFPVSFRLGTIHDELIQLKDDSMLFHNKLDNMVMRSSGFDVHVMHKASLSQWLPKTLA